MGIIVPGQEKENVSLEKSWSVFYSFILFNLKNRFTKNKKPKKSRPAGIFNARARGEGGGGGGEL